MKISVNWLQDFIRLDESPARIAADLAMLGLPVDTVEPVGSDAVLDVDVTANRADCLSHLGIARELAAAYREPLHPPAADSAGLPGSPLVPVSITIEDPALCFRYCGLVIRGVRIAPSPAWLAERLQAVGQRPINNIVDITNYVLQELGHPLHAFDFRKLKGSEIRVRQARAGETIRTLDGKLRELAPPMLVIADRQDPVAIAGVMGGFDSEVDDGTRDILLESAWFLPGSIRQTARAVGLGTEASYRYERGADPAILPYALLRATRLILALAGGEAATPPIDVFPTVPSPAEIHLRRDQTRRLIGASVADTFVEEILSWLQFTIAGRTTEGWQVQAPLFRSDVSLEVDLIEEIARFHGYNRLPATLPLVAGHPVQRQFVAQREQSRQYFKENGCQEILTLSFTDRKKDALFQWNPCGDLVQLANPLVEEEPFMRRSLLAGMANALKFNENNYNQDFRLFELAAAHFREGGDCREEWRLAVGITGHFLPANWAGPGTLFQFFHLKGLLEGLFQALDVENWEVVPETGLPFLQPGAGAMVQVNGVAAGVFGQLNELVAQDFKFRQKVFLGEIRLAGLSPRGRKPFTFTPLPRYPFVDRDVSFAVDNTKSFSTIKKTIDDLKIPELHQVRLIDLYRCKDIAAGLAAMTIRLVFLHPQRTLTDVEADSLRDRLTQALIAAHHISFR